MVRWAITIVAVVFAATGGYLVARLGSQSRSPQTVRSESRLEETRAELSGLRQEKQDLQQRLEQLTKEQERLAQENEILRKQQVTDELLSGKGGELPARPLK